MKKLLFFSILILLFSCVVFSQDIVYNSTPTLMWNAVTEDGDGNPFLPEDIVEYDVYLWDTSMGDIEVQPIGNLVPFIITSTTQTILNFPYRSNWACAIRTILTDGDSNIIYSDLAYTTELPPVTAISPFVYVPSSTGTIILAPMGLRDSGM